MALVAAAVLAIALWLEPDPAGHGTHTALGLSGCRWIVLMELPCPTCGMTTAYAHAVRGEFAASFFAQPLGFLLSLATGAAFFIGLYVVATGHAVGSMLARVLTARFAWGMVGLVLLAWLFKIFSVKGLLS